MKIKRYKVEYDSISHTIFGVACENGRYVEYKDYEHLSEYCDRIVQFSKLPCLPKDLEVLRKANEVFAEENIALQTTVDDLKGQIEGWENKWKCAVDMAAHAQFERDDALKLRDKWHRKWWTLRNEYVVKIDMIKEKLGDILNENITGK
jgi:hypothetical protein